MSRIDAYEAQRGPVRRRKARRWPADPKRAKREGQLAMTLYGGATKEEKQTGEPFDDPIPF